MFKKLFYISVVIILILIFSLAYTFSNLTNAQQNNDNLKAMAVTNTTDIKDLKKEIFRLEECSKGDKQVIKMLERDLETYKKALNTKNNDKVRVIEYLSLTDVAPWFKVDTISELKIESTNSLVKNEVIVPLNVLKSIDYTQIIGPITYVQDCSFYYHPPDTNTYKYIFTVGSEQHYIEFINEEVLVIDGVWVKCHTKLHMLGDAFVSNNYSKLFTDTKQLLYLSSLISLYMDNNKKISDSDIRKWRINFFVDEILMKANQIDNKPENLPNSNYSYKLYCFGNYIDVISYGDYVELINPLINESLWYFAEDLETNLVSTLVSGG